MDFSHLKLITAKDVSDFDSRISAVTAAAWPEFMLHSPVASQFWDDMDVLLPEFQFALLDPETDEAIAFANSLALCWNGADEDLPEQGWDWEFSTFSADVRSGQPLRTQAAVQIVIHPNQQGQGLSTYMIKLMSAIGRAHGLTRLIAPVRPNLKHKYPLANIDEYITWQTERGELFDPWLRVHARAGAKLIKPCHESMLYRAPIANWEAWTGMRFPASGLYTVPGALVPVEVDRAKDEVTYIEPNVWMVHPLSADGR